jgi:soluble lytic murein transglycosylase
MYRETMENMADKYGVPFPLILAVARTESHFDRLAVSPVGASGIMQLMPKTAAQLGLADDNDIFEASTNIDLGTKHLRDLLKRYLGNTVYSAAAYNAGHSPVDLWRERLKEVDAELWIEFIGYPETKMYVKRVLAAQHQYSKRLMQEHRIQ